jgi:hypothetical protein
MIVSHRHRFIFLKTSKTASTSVEIALSKYCGEQDVITPISQRDERRRKALGYPGPRNYVLPEPVEPGAGTRGPRRFRRHMRAIRVRDLLPPAVWESYYKFCVVRNPWDRLVSMYFWRTRSPDAGGIDSFLADGLPRSLRRLGIDIYTIDGEVVVDRLCRFDHLEQDLEEVRKTIGLPGPLDLPAAKTGIRPPGTPYQDVLSADCIESVARHCDDELNILAAL